LNSPTTVFTTVLTWLFVTFINSEFTEVEYLPKIYIMLAHTDSLVMKTIRFYTHAKYNHVSICVDERMEYFYSFGRRYIRFPLIGGFIREELNKGVYLYFKNASCCIYSLDVSEEKYNVIVELIKCYGNNRYKYHYNFAALLGIMINKPLKMKNRYTCSEFAATLLSTASIYTFNKDASLVVPDNFKSIPGLSKLYEGPMVNFQTGTVLQF